MSAVDVAGRPADRSAGRLQTIVVIAVTVGVIGLAAFLIGGGTSSSDGVTQVDLGSAAAANAPKVGTVPPSFRGVTYDGKPLDFSTYLSSGRPVWLTFGASWCPDCRNEAPDVEAAYQANKDKVDVVAVFMNEPADAIAGYASRAGLTFPILVDENADVSAAYRTQGIPTHFFIRADGTVNQVRIGALSKDEMDRALAAIQE
jgi:cytochrome c biogenesis protein CcmG, thiol:disulfide interchange protein DsbE